MGQPMDLNFHLFETASLLINVLVVAFLLLVRKLHNLHFENLLFHSCQIRLFKKFCQRFQEGTSNCLKGLMLILCYLIVAASFYVYADPNVDGECHLQTLSLFAI
jgi:Ca2+:H+ antiporter